MADDLHIHQVHVLRYFPDLLQGLLSGVGNGQVDPEHQHGHDDPGPLTEPGFMEALVGLVPAALAVEIQRITDKGEDDHQEDRGDRRGEHMDIVNLLRHAGGGLGKIQSHLGTGGTGPTGEERKYG